MPVNTHRPTDQRPSWLEVVRRTRIIAAVRGADDLAGLERTDVGVVFVLNCTIFELRAIAQTCRHLGRYTFAHLDLVEGVGKDAAGVELLAREVGVDGIITTRSALIRDARRVGLLAIQRVFLLDSASLSTAVSVVRGTRPDAVEIMPALIVPAIQARIPFRELPPVIAGGLVQSPDELRYVLSSPVVAVSTSAAGLWSLRP